MIGKGVIVIFRYDDVVEYLDIEDLQLLCQPFGEVGICAAGGDIARGVVMCEDYSRCQRLDPVFQDQLEVNQRTADTSLADLHIVRD